jgi:hypothetical protein
VLKGKLVQAVAYMRTSSGMPPVEKRSERSERGERTFVPHGSVVEHSAASFYPASRYHHR